MRRFPYRYARLKYAVNSAILFLLDSEVSAWPTNPKLLIKDNGWHLKRYSAMAAETDCVFSAGEVSAELLIEDAFTMAIAGAYHIAYNDALTPKERIRFSLCHEIGHIVLGHCEVFGGMILPKAQRELLDREANAFAANLLCPVPLYEVVMRELNDPEKARSIFGMSKQSWGVRHRTIERDRHYLDPALAKQIAQQADRLIALAHEYTSIDQENAKAENQQTTAQQITLFPPRGWQHNPQAKHYDSLLQIGKGLLESREAVGHQAPSVGTFDSAWNMHCAFTSMIQDEVWKRECKKKGTFHEVLMVENPMVIDELWEPKRQPRRRRNQNA